MFRSSWMRPSFVTTSSEIPSAVFALVKDQILLASTELPEVMFADYEDCAVESMTLGNGLANQVAENTVS